VDSVYVDPITHVTYYYTVNVDVYDSIDHNATETLTDRYSYLQIPVSVSYELANYKKLSFHVQLNGTYHLLKDDFRNYKPFFEPSSRLISTRMEGKKLTSDYWSAGAGILISYRMGARSGINITPGFRYNFMTVSGSSDKKLNSYGINFGFYYKLLDY
jgi:hypothetical protein